MVNLVDDCALDVVAHELTTLSHFYHFWVRIELFCHRECFDSLIRLEIEVNQGCFGQRDGIVFGQNAEIGTGERFEGHFSRGWDQGQFGTCDPEVLDDAHVEVNGQGENGQSHYDWLECGVFTFFVYKKFDLFNCIRIVVGEGLHLGWKYYDRSDRWVCFSILNTVEQPKPFSKVLFVDGYFGLTLNYIEGDGKNIFSKVCRWKIYKEYRNEKIRRKWLDYHIKHIIKSKSLV